jgi:hypothetical protein
MKAQFRSGPGKAFKLIFALLVIVIISSCNICFKVLMSFIIIYIFVKIIFSISILYLILVGASSLFKKKRKKEKERVFTAFYLGRSGEFDIFVGKEFKLFL